MASFYNSEGYADPTSYYALTKIEQEEKAAQKACCFRPVVYICSPFSGNISNNVQKARLYSRFAVDALSAARKTLRRYPFCTAFAVSAVYV